MRMLFGALALAASLSAVMPAQAGEADLYQVEPSQRTAPGDRYYNRYGQPRYERRDYEPPRYRPEYRPDYRPEPRFAGYGYGRGCNAVKGTFCWVSRPRPLGASCGCPKDGGVREGYIDR
jgi:hypothetical protein